MEFVLCSSIFRYGLISKVECKVKQIRVSNIALYKENLPVIVLVIKNNALIACQNPVIALFFWNAAGTQNVDFWSALQDVIWTHLFFLTPFFFQFSSLLSVLFRNNLVWICFSRSINFHFLVIRSALNWILLYRFWEFVGKDNWHEKKVCWELGSGKKNHIIEIDY